MAAIQQLRTVIKRCIKSKSINENLIDHLKAVSKLESLKLKDQEYVQLMRLTRPMSVDLRFKCFLTIGDVWLKERGDIDVLAKYRDYCSLYLFLIQRIDKKRAMKLYNEIKTKDDWWSHIGLRLTIRGAYRNNILNSKIDSIARSVSSQFRGSIAKEMVKKYEIERNRRLVEWLPEGNNDLFRMLLKYKDLSNAEKFAKLTNNQLQLDSIANIQNLLKAYGNKQSVYSARLKSIGNGQPVTRSPEVLTAWYAIAKKAVRRSVISSKLINAIHNKESFDQFDTAFQQVSLINLDLSLQILELLEHANKQSRSLVRNENNDLLYLPPLTDRNYIMIVNTALKSNNYALALSIPSRIIQNGLEINPKIYRMILLKSIKDSKHQYIKTVYQDIVSNYATIDEATYKLLWVSISDYYLNNIQPHDQLISVDELLRFYNEQNINGSYKLFRSMLEGCLAQNDFIGAVLVLERMFVSTELQFDTKIAKDIFFIICANSKIDKTHTTKKKGWIDVHTRQKAFELQQYPINEWQDLALVLYFESGMDSEEFQTKLDQRRNQINP
ncbi:hypothetical protein CANCADRAFT_44907 [Tortispora caseinolytica NRRL Y-17796]|uniref:Uncharacterized protein n=1 Tax=Tortispora caseinolytica NRRL Y-17796 TaxID=767744 RepID=A0A1E4THT5_9ASCO|nr:hypothetical protein CANCADRAFT_44907 [Tortispora caseinolytica NRRL Y-17796]